MSYCNLSMVLAKMLIKSKCGICSSIAVVCLLSPNLAEVVRANDRVVILAEATTEQKVIYVDPQLGNDAQNTGNRESPFKTITQALKIARSGTTIKLAPGTYSVETGETFPLILQERVTIEGNIGSQGYSTIIRGEGYFISHTGAGQSVTIAAIKNAGSITGVTLTNPDNRGHGLWIESASPQVSHNTFTRNGNTGVSVNGLSSPAIANNYFYNNSGNGLLIYDNSQPQVIDNLFEKTGFGVSIVRDSAAIITGNRFIGNRIGIILENSAQGTFRNNQIETSQEIGLVAISQSRVDLGTTSNPGNNIFRSNNKLDIQNASNNQIVAVGNQINGSTEGNIALNSVNNSPVTIAALISPASSSPKPPSSQAPSLPLSPSLNSPISESLPAPPPIANSDSGQEAELIFTAPQATETLPVPKKIEPPSNSPVLVNSATYRVVVEAVDSEQRSKVRSLYPQAFSTVYRGDPVLQIGAFRDRAKAETASQSLEDLGLDTYVLDR
jgi:parallel beta-helix repeat protein